MEDGWHVVAADRDSDALDALVHSSPGSAPLSTEVMDVTDRGAVVAALARLGTLDLLVNNAGIAGKRCAVGTISEAEFRDVLRVNMLGIFIASQEAVRRMGKGGAIVNIASASYLVSPNVPHYGMTKGAVVGLTRSMALEFRRHGISVNAVGPGAIDTTMQSALSDEQRAHLARIYSDGPMPPDVIAAAVRYLASSEGRRARGQMLIVDEGTSLGIDLW
ncbi:SocA oxidoreductase, short chain dehydrogenase/reductase family [Sphingopyxis granuli]|uniref:SocA oxidoreductase, short chain dehydrogenase/reductase family n=1 Tax=Sphingopyxis granuli TaxID=267128 RepID=A0AA86GK08_9SPHN|nr:SocA oxidoreductase, short chain dehydrogenase/reductase family [Sphingopyxis granuli]